MDGNLQTRKADHLTLCATEDVGFRTRSTLFEDVRLVHNALPELSVTEIDTRCTLLGKSLRAPILIAAMTGGTDEAGRVNRELAKVAEQRGYGFGVGSQRAMAGTTEMAPSYQVRSVAPTTLVLGNLGVVQARAMTTEQIRALLADIAADALCIHLNPAMEMIQSHGDRDFRENLSTLERLHRDLGLPVVAKETGCGLSARVGGRLRAIGINHVDVSGAGGTSWVGVETQRARQKNDSQAAHLGEALWDWGIPTAASVAMMAPYGFHSLIATGGIATGLDIAKAIALGAHAAGLARPVLKALHQGGPEQVHAEFDAIEQELRAVMLLTGSRNLDALRNADKLILGELNAWATAFARPPKSC